MVRTKSCSALVVIGLLAVLAACQDAPTLPTAALSRTAEVARSSQGLHLGEVAFYCIEGRYAPATPTAWQTRSRALWFPRGELSAGGRTVRYEYRRSGLDGWLLSAASCVVPYSEGALRRMDRAFGVKGGGGADQFRARQEMVTIQGGCVTSPDGICPVDPITVTAPPRERIAEVQCSAMDPNCGNSGGEDGGWGDGSWSGGGDGDGSPSGDEDNDGETLHDGPVLYTICVAIKLGAGGWSAIGGTAVSAYMAWDARKNSRDAYDMWDRYRRDVAAGLTPNNIYINDLYYQRWKDAEHQEQLMYVAVAAGAAWSAFEIFQAAVACAPYGVAPV